MRIVHFSDWHGIYRALPEADLYVCTGDMLPNWCVRSPVGKKVPKWYYDDSDWFFDVEFEAERQAEWCHRFVYSQGGWGRYLPDPAAPVVCVRGNHDFVDLSLLFADCNLVHEFVDNEVVEVLGKRVTGHRGIPRIFGSWNDEVSRPDLVDRFGRMLSGTSGPDHLRKCDLYLTHYPPHGVLDKGYEHYGLDSAAGRMIAEHCEESYESLFSGAPVLDPGPEPVNAVHCFGHIHEQGGKTQQLGNVLFSNAACWYNAIGDVW